MDFTNWKVGEPIEMFINKNTTFMQFAEMIIKYYPESKVKIIILNIK